MQTTGVVHSLFFTGGTQQDNKTLLLYTHWHVSHTIVYKVFQLSPIEGCFGKEHDAGEVHLIQYSV